MLVVVAFVVIYGWWGVSMITQTSRWRSTPAYADLFGVLAPAWWGVIYLACAVLALAGVVAILVGRRVVICQAAIALMFVLTSGWTVAFFVRYLTSKSTTPFTIGSSLLHLFMLWQASRLIDRHREIPSAVEP